MRSIVNILKIFVAFFYDYARGLSYTIITILVLGYCLHPARFASHYTFIKTEDIYDEMEKSYPARDNSCTITINHQKSQLLYPEEHPREDPIAMARRLDVDLIPQNPDNIYACTKMPRHMSSSVNTFRYNLPYSGLFGGAIALTRKQFERVNGFSNVFYGWGGEDDDFYSRLQSKGFQVTRFGPDIAQYYMLVHKKESPSSARFENLENSAKRYDTDGISNLEYRVLNHQLRPLYSWILADV